MEDKGLPDFSGKVVIFYLRNSPSSCDDGVLMEYLDFEKREGRFFVIGRIPEMQGGEWIANCQTAIAWDSVIRYIEFKSMEDYKERASKYKPTIIERLTNK